jgi:hypothetical protein
MSVPFDQLKHYLTNWSSRFAIPIRVPIVVSGCQSWLSGKSCRKPNKQNFLDFTGGQGVNRTLDTRIFSPLLYRLSYLPTVTAGSYPRAMRPANHHSYPPVQYLAIERRNLADFTCCVSGNA